MSDTVSKNEISEAVNAVLDCVQNNLAGQPKHAREVYQLILGSLKTSNERLWFGTSLRLGQIYLIDKSFELLDELVLELKKACKKADAQSENLLDVDVYDVSKGNHLLEVFALEIQMCIETREQRRIK